MPACQEGGVVGREAACQESTPESTGELKATPILQAVNLAFRISKKPRTKSMCVFEQVSEIYLYLNFIDILWYDDNGTSAGIPQFDHNG